jgi:protein-L-isoaspartate(D-aspartate) O-methyltransferase
MDARPDVAGARSFRSMAEPVEQMLATIDRHARACRAVLGRDRIDPAVLAAIRRVPRERFVPEDSRAFAHGDHPLSIGHGQTISQPFIVALMTDLLNVAPGQHVLEVGTGCGYQAAVLAELGAAVETIEIVPELALTARQTLAALGQERVTVHVGDGHGGLPERAPFDRIIVTAAPPEVPGALLEQLAPGGRLVIPVGSWHAQELLVIEKGDEGRLRERRVLPVAFVPLTGQGRA